MNRIRTIQGAADELRKRDHHIDLAHIKLQEVRTAQLGNQNRNGFPLGITDNQRRGEIVVPRSHKGKDGLHRDSGLQDRQDDHIEGVELAGAINASCLNQFLRQAGIHVLLHEKEHSRCRNAGQNQRPQRIGQVHIVHQAKETQRRYLHPAYTFRNLRTVSAINSSTRSTITRLRHTAIYAANIPTDNTVRICKRSSIIYC